MERIKFRGSTSKKRRGPFQVLGSREVYKNPWIEVREDSVIRPDGERGIFGVVEMQPGVQVVAIDQQGCCYLTREYHYGVGRITTEVVAGGIERNEKPLQAAKRELREETGLIASQWKFLGKFFPLSTVMYSPQYIFLAMNVKQVAGQSAEDRDSVTIQRTHFNKAVEMVAQHKVDIAPSMVALLRAAQWLASKNHAFAKS